MTIAIIDYGMGNLKNVQKAFEKLGVEALITEDKKQIEAADKVVLPGVGAFAQAMETLREKKLDEVIKGVVERGVPLLGICLGMQLFFETSYENGVYKGLGLLPGEVIRLEGDLKIPHMGWNTLEIEKPVPLFDEIGKSPYVYFVHSYHISTEEDIISAYTTYGKRIPVAVQKGHLYGMQFHPEKSSDIGLNILKQFAML